MTHQDSSFAEPPAQLIARFESLGLSDIDRLAEAMLKHLPRGIVIGLVGTLGAGKTTFVQAIARGAGIDDSEVTSPTFTLLQTHRGERTLYHLDTYRVADEDEFLELGVEELYEDENAWTLIEWADRMPGALPSSTLWIRLGLAEQADQRNVSVYSDNPKMQTLFGLVKSQMDDAE